MHHAPVADQSSVAGPRHGLRRSNQIRHQPIIDIEQAFIFAEIASVVAFVEHAPDFWPQAQRVRQDLEDDVAVGGTESSLAQRRQADSVGLIGF